LLKISIVQSSACQINCVQRSDQGVKNYYIENHLNKIKAYGTSINVKFICVVPSGSVIVNVNERIHLY